MKTLHFFDSKREYDIAESLNIMGKVEERKEHTIDKKMSTI
jgi:hypothetical protein